MSFERREARSIDPPNAVATASTVAQAPSDSISTSPQPVNQPQSWAARLPAHYVVPLCGATAGAVSGLVSCPLDVIKTKLQAQGGFRLPRQDVTLPAGAYRGVSGTAAIIWREEGVRGMYRGLGPMLLGYVPTWAVYLTVYNRAQAFFRTKTDSLFLANVYASLSAGGCSTMATNPIWVIKTRLMAQSNTTAAVNHSRPPWQYRNTIDAARKMYRAEGLLSFYSGLTPALFGLTHVAIQFPLYEVLKEKFTGIGVGTNETEEDRKHHFYGLALAVFLSKTQLRSSSNPISNNVLSRRTNSDYGHHPGTPAPSKTLRSLPYRGTIQTCKTILMEEGWRGFYAGLGTNLIRAVPAAMTTILTFEYLKKTMMNLRLEGDERLDLPE